MSRSWGGDRGRPIDRYYIERFLGENEADIRGRVMEIGDRLYTRRFGRDRVSCSEVLDLDPNSETATLVGDLADAPQIPDSSFDCIVCTQTLQLIPNVSGAVATLSRLLKPGGVALVTVPGISRLASEESDYWRFSSRGAKWLFEHEFPATSLYVTSSGNVLAATAFLSGLSAEELTAEELDFLDPDYEVVVTIRAAKTDSGP